MRQIDFENGYLPPQAIDLEKTVLGAIMIERDAIIDVVDKLNPIDFYVEAHKCIYSVCVTIFQRNHNIDMLTVVEELKKIGKLEEVGGPYAIAQICNSVASCAHIIDHAGYIKECSVKRQLIEISATIMKKGYQNEVDGADLLAYAMDQIMALNANINSLSQKSFRDGTLEAYQQIRDAAMNPNQINGLPYYIRSLDLHTLGMQDTDLMIIAGRPGMGKTAFAMQIAKDQAKNGAPVGVISCEMSMRQLIQRIMCNEMNIDMQSLQKGKLAEQQWIKLDETTNQIMDYPMFVNDKGGLTVEDVCAIAKAWKIKHGIKSLFIDYLQMLNASKKTGNREQEISHISRELKSLAKNLNIPIITLSQLSRSCETRGGSKRPMLSDLRESGSIEQDADMVMFLYRAEYYDILQDEGGYPTAGVVEVDIQKYRAGKTGPVRLQCNMEIFKFFEMQHHQF